MHKTIIAVAMPKTIAGARRVAVIAIAAAALVGASVGSANAQIVPRPNPYCICKAATKTWWCPSGPGGTGALINTGLRCM